MPSDKKKNPGLILDFEDSYNIVFISSKNYLLNDKGFDFSRKPKKNRIIFDSYPIYLKHTLMH